MNLASKIGLNSIVVQNSSLDAVDMDGEKVMMNLDKGKYYALNQVGSRIWELINEPVSVKEIVNALINEYEIDLDKCKEAVVEFLGRMNDAELISIN